MSCRHLLEGNTLLHRQCRAEGPHGSEAFVPAGCDDGPGPGVSWGWKAPGSRQGWKRTLMPQVGWRHSVPLMPRVVRFETRDAPPQAGCCPKSCGSPRGKGAPNRRQGPTEVGALLARKRRRRTDRGRDDGAPCGRVSSGDPQGQRLACQSAWMGRCPSPRITWPPSVRRWARSCAGTGSGADSTRMWRRGDDVEGWLVVAWQGDKWNTKAAGRGVAERGRVAARDSRAPRRAAGQ